jgi:hypothetical protein
MFEESVKQMTWHKEGVRYNHDKMVHPADGQARKMFNDNHRLKHLEARNVRVALATDGFNPHGLMSAPYTCWPVFAIPPKSPSRGPTSTAKHILDVDNSWTLEKQNGCVHATCL